MRFILTRHGEKQKIESPHYEDHFNAALSANGIGQIIQLGKFLKTEYPALTGQKYVYCSAMPRSIESAEVLRTVIGMREISVWKDIQEYFGTNDYSLSRDERRILHIEAIKDRNLIPTDVGKSLNQAISGFQKTLETIAKESAEEYILIAGHGMINRYFIYTFAPELEPSPETTFEYGSKAGGYSLIEYNDGKFSLLEYNVLP